MPRNGCPRITTPVQDQYIYTTHLHNLFQTAWSIANTLSEPPRISVNTILRHLHKQDNDPCSSSCLASKTCTTTHPCMLVVSDGHGGNGQMLCSVMNLGFSLKSMIAMLRPDAMSNSHNLCPGSHKFFTWKCHDEVVLLKLFTPT